MILSSSLHKQNPTPSLSGKGFSLSGFFKTTMPTVSIGRDRLFEALGKTYTEEEFKELCSRFGIKLDDVAYVTSEKEKHLDKGAKGNGEIIYKIIVPDHRSDLLCLEGIAQALRIFNGQQEIPTYKVANISTKSMIKMHVKQETCSVRPYVLCAVLRDVTFDTASYNSFIDLQDKLHENICRQRTLVAIGTHDLDTLHGPFTYEALPPSSINFVPLKQEKNFRADELMEFYKSDLKLEKFLHIIENSPVFPVLYDSTRTVLSLPPIINGAHSAIKLETKNVFIECTATDLSKAEIVLNVMAKMLSEYCERKFEIEPVEVIYCDGKSYIYPDLSVYNMGVSLSNITGAIGVPLVVDEERSRPNVPQDPPTVLVENVGAVGGAVVGGATRVHNPQDLEYLQDSVSGAVGGATRVHNQQDLEYLQDCIETEEPFPGVDVASAVNIYGGSVSDKSSEKGPDKSVHESLTGMETLSLTMVMALLVLCITLVATSATQNTHRAYILECIAFVVGLFGFLCTNVSIVMKRRTQKKLWAYILIEIAIALDVCCALLLASAVVPPHFLPFTYAADVLAIVSYVMLVVHSRY